MNVTGSTMTAQGTTNNSAADTIHWKQVASLIMLNVAINISWLAYHKFQPELLKQFKFTEFSFFLAFVQMLVLTITPPVAGLLADRIRRKKGDRLPVINIGINVVSMVFMAVAFTVFVNPTGFIRYLFPLMIVLWLISMNTFHSPAVSTVELFVPQHKLPQVMAIFAFTTDLTQAIEPSLVEIIQAVGAPITFVLGGLLVFASGYWLQSNTREWQNNKSEVDSNANTMSKHAITQTEFSFVIIFILGTCMGLATTLFFEIFPTWSEKYVSFVGDKGMKGSYFTSILIAASAIFALILGHQVEKIGILRTVIIAFTTILTLILLIFLFQNSIIGTTAFFIYPLAFALFGVSSLPLVFDNSNSRNRVLAVGLYFSGIEFVNGIFDIWQTI